MRKVVIFKKKKESQLKNKNLYKETMVKFVRIGLKQVLLIQKHQKMV